MMSYCSLYLSQFTYNFSNQIDVVWRYSAVLKHLNVAWKITVHDLTFELSNLVSSAGLIVERIRFIFIP